MRAFIALELPPDFTADVVALSRQLSAVINGRFTSSSSWHLTLAFLGDLDQMQVADATDALEAACVCVGPDVSEQGDGDMNAVSTRASASPILLRSDGLGKFGRTHDATLWLGVVAFPELMELADRLRDELGARDVPFDGKAFKPHITLARHANIPQGSLPDLVFPRDDEATHVTLFKSTLDRSGAIYQPLHTVELGV